jgi:hypothetical protein
MFDVCDYSMTKGFYVSSIEKCGVEDCMKRAKWPGKILENLKPMLLCETHAKMWRKEIAVSKEEVCNSCGEKGSTLLVKCNFERCNRAYHVRIPCLKGIQKNRKSLFTYF